MAERKHLFMDEGVKVEVPNSATSLQLKMTWTCLLSILTDGNINNASIKYHMTDIVYTCQILAGSVFVNKNVLQWGQVSCYDDRLSSGQTPIFEFWGFTVSRLLTENGSILHMTSLSYLTYVFESQPHLNFALSRCCLDNLLRSVKKTSCT